MQFKLYFRSIVMVTILSVHALSSYGQKGFFKPVKNAKMDLTKMKKIEKYSVYNLRTSDLRSYLLQAPLEFKSETAVPLALEIPMPDGQVETFQILESPILSPKIAAENPDIKTYTGKGTVNKNSVIRLSLTSGGFNAIILLGDGSAVYFERLPGAANETYFNYFSKDAVSPKSSGLKAGGGSGGKDYIELPKDTKPRPSQRQAAIDDIPSTGTALTTFRMSLSADSKFVTAHGGTASSAFVAAAEYVNRINAFMRVELSVGFTIVSGTSLMFTDVNTDPFADPITHLPLSQLAIIDKNQVITDAALSSANYDIGHVFSTLPGTSGAGLAYQGLCNNTFKARGVTLEGDLDSYVQAFYDKIFFHEVGHQFGMNHSYNSSIPVCDSRNPATSVEPGAGITIMSYSMICFAGGVPNLGDDYFVLNYPVPATQLLLQYHSTSYQEAITYMNTIFPYPAGVVVTPISNTPPVIAPIPGHTIPKSTPFVLTGSATDGQGDAITYTWDGTDTGGDELNPPDANTLLDTSKPPFSRTYGVSPTGNTRTFPILSGILDGSNTARADKLPSIGTTLHYNLTARDNNPAGGGVSFASTTVTVDGGSGPFLINNDGPGGGLTGSHLAGSPQAVTWSVNNTNNPAGINCQLVDILLSTDGGLTFPRTLLSATPNTGLAAVILPLDVNTIKARIKVAASSSNADLPLIGGRVMANTPNIFFDISNVNFGITTALPVTLAAFNVELKGKNNASLTWETSEETNNKGFDIEMSPDARNFVKVGFVDGNGDSKITQQYHYSINDLAGGNYYFRLKQLDYDGKFEYSQIRNLAVISSSDVLSIYPNPTSGKLKFNPDMHKNQAFSIQVANQSGKVVLSLPASASYTNGYELDASSLASGLYHIVIQGANFTENLKFVKL
ncbi:zinc-dependent metalloprotease [Dyadobacter arcticus]|uniref:Secretion system C-terminal sorting domain-containing protein n=1 Tax=Dyadobacter arcticus TaxID=1078754 RepID=A0ABX0UR65_9BACT|nr:zinc-dependent metalloprotease [Dyadobacter arcticus]NIJ55472.1 hypothetical protein [Dyadobacter arcticus]